MKWGLGLWRCKAARRPSRHHSATAIRMEMSDSSSRNDSGHGHRGWSWSKSKARPDMCVVSDPVIVGNFS